MDKSKLEKTELKIFCYNVFTQEKVRIFFFDNSPRIAFHIKIRKRHKRNGCVHIISALKLNYYAITINLWPVLSDNSSSKQMKKFYLYTTIVHELTHIKLQCGLKKTSMLSIYEIIIAWKQLFKYGTARIPSANNYFIRAVADKKERRRLFLLPFEEYYCIYHGMKHANNALGSTLSPEELESVNRFNESLSFILNNLEITYGHDGYPRNLFISSIKHMQKYIRVRKSPFKSYPDLSLLFDENGNFLIDFFVEQINLTSNSDSDAYKWVLLQLFIHTSMDWSILFATIDGLKQMISMMADNYCQACIDYLKNMNVGSIFVPEQILQDNAAMKIKSVKKLEKKMEMYGMERTSGGIVALY